MLVTRLDLDGAGSPSSLVTKILRQEPALKIPVAIEELARQLDIGEIQDIEADGFIGGLLTDEVRSFGFVLVKRGLDYRRRRFTIGHELGHFLLPFHKPVQEGQFVCSQADMVRWPDAEQGRAIRMEAEANQFSALILMPPPHLRNMIARTGDPDLKHVVAIHETYEVSKDAAARSYAQYHDQKIAILIVKDGVIKRVYRNAGFPTLCVWRGSPVPRTTGFHYLGNAVGQVSGLRQIGGENWLETNIGNTVPNTYEQIMSQANGWAMIMLWVDSVESDFDPDEDRTSKQRFADRQARWQR